MISKNFFKVCLILGLLISSLLACSIPTINSSSDIPAASPTPPATTPTPALDTWTTAGTGIELRYEDWKSQGNNEDIVTIVRLDPHRVHLKVGYRPNKPTFINEWMRQENAKAIINGGYFNQNNSASALVVSNGQAYGTSYNGFGGMLSVDTQGNISLRSLSQQPYDPNNEQLQQATQSSPMLIVNGKRTQFNANAASQRRSVIAEDTKGRLLLIVSPNEAFTLDELADVLVASDLSIKTALNLDGGASTGLYVNAGSQHVAIDALAALPIVIIVT